MACPYVRVPRGLARVGNKPLITPHLLSPLDFLTLSFVFIDILALFPQFCSRRVEKSRSHPQALGWGRGLESAVAFHRAALHLLYSSTF